ncbi:transcriptional repressor LexA [Bdellovibrio sp. HCB337]|uniref:transcriptional repressor LexA n=1 Tax=Bdellovibrio sp. HCB337 TaxID=3394358 RepID=UPI0039A5F320
MVHENSPLPLKANLTLKEKAVLEFIDGFQQSSGISPSYQEIRDHFGFASFNSVQNYLKQLTRKGYVSVSANQKRSLQLVQKPPSIYTSTGPSPTSLLQSKEEVLSLPLLGKVAAGCPIESLKNDEFISVPSAMVRQGDKTFALMVQGDSMINEGIWDGDTILVQQQSSAKNGDLVVATVENEATVKRFFLRTPPRGSHDELMVELRPANEKLQSLWLSPYEVTIKGIVVGLLRKF